MTEINRTLDRSLMILKELAKEEAIGIRELSRISDVSLAATERIIKTLEAHNFVDKDKSGKYILGRELFYLGKVVESRIGVLQIMMEELRLLVNEIDETVYLVEKRDKSIVFIDGVQSRHPIQYVPKMGKLYDLPYGVTGKVFLSLMPEKQAKEILEYYNMDYGNIANELQLIRDNGYGVSYEERFKGLAGYGFPLISKDGSVPFLLSIAIPTYRFDEEKKDFIVKSVKKTIKKLSLFMEKTI